MRGPFNFSAVFLVFLYIVKKICLRLEEFHLCWNFFFLIEKIANTRNAKKINELFFVHLEYAHSKKRKFLTKQSFEQKTKQKLKTVFFSVYKFK